MTVASPLSYYQLEQHPSLDVLDLAEHEQGDGSSDG